MYEVRGLGQDPTERVQWIGWNTVSGLLTIFFSSYILETVESVCDPEDTRFEKKRENDSHSCPHFRAEQSRAEEKSKYQKIVACENPRREYVKCCENIIC